MVRGSVADRRFYVHQADAVISQANPGSGTEYPVLLTTFARIISIEVDILETVAPLLEIHVTIDGQVITYALAAAANGVIYIARNTPWNTLNAELAVESVHDARNFLLEGKSIEITAERTGGTVTNLAVRVKYSRYL